MLHKRLGYTSIPKSCPRHKQPPRTYASQKCTGECDGAEVEKCELYQRGICTYGVKCKIARVDGQLAIAHPFVVEEEDEEDDLIVWQAYMPSNEEDSCYEKATIESDEEYGEIISW